MGCDIHTHIEYKRNIYIGTDKNNNAKYEEKWICGDFFTPNAYFGTAEDEKEYNLVGFCNDRNYDLFSILADVRNYGNMDYISQPKGLPEDITEIVKKDADEWDLDGHSHSYLTLKELIDFHNKSLPLKHRGMISPQSQKELDEKGITPEMWCQCTNQEGWEFREWTEENNVLVPLIESLKERANEHSVIYGFLWEREPEEAYKLSDKIRIVFWFDN